MKIHKYYFLLSLAVVAVDQVSKMWVHLHVPMGLEGQVTLLGDWLKLHHTSNPGMAFGLNTGLSTPAFSMIRLVFILILGFFLHLLATHRIRARVIWSVSLILGGALGNMIDNVFYGVILEGPAQGWFNGPVIDWIYLDVWKGIVPARTPILGEKYMTIFPIFNLADLAIFVGVISILFTTRPYRSSTSW